MSPRQKEFHPERVLDGAMRLFWRKGYQGTSVQDLVSETGINRFSLYDTFGDKHELFVASCAKFRNLMEQEHLPVLDRGPGGMAAIQEFFNCVADSFEQDEKPHGCLMTNSIVERAMTDQEVRQWAQDFLTRIEEAFHGALVRARAAGELGSQNDLRALAKGLVCILQGVNVLGKAFPNGGPVREIVRTMLSQLR